MSSRMVRIQLLASLALPLLALSGCTWPLNTQFSSPSVHLPVPIPLSPYFQKEQEDKFWMRERYQRVPILGPVTAGGEPVALDPPSPDEVMRALERARNVEGGVPLLHEIQRNNVRMVVEPISDYVDPPRVYPLIGPAQLHHAHYKCIIYYTEMTRVGWPIPYTTVDEDAQEVIYIDHNHFHMVGNVNDGPGGNL
jgi:hypothetical protein